jgi:FMN-dependent NADH-azoreductase
MTYILIVESSPRGTESASRKLTDKLRERLEMQYPKATIIERDLVKDKLPQLDQPTLKAISTKDSVAPISARTTMREPIHPSVWTDCFPSSPGSEQTRNRD